MRIPALGKYNVTPPRQSFQGTLAALNVDDLSDERFQRSCAPNLVWLVTGEQYTIPSLLGLRAVNPAGVIFEKGGANFHPAIYLSAEGVPCAANPIADISELAGQHVVFDLQEGHVKAGDDAQDHGIFDIEDHFSRLHPDAYRTRCNVNVCVRSMSELNYFMRLKQIGIEVPFVVLFMEPAILQTPEDPYRAARRRCPQLRELLSRYIEAALMVAQRGVYIRTPEVTAQERGCDEKGAAGLSELRGIPYDLHRDTSFLEFLFDLVGELASRPENNGRLHVALAMPRSVDDLIASKHLLADSLARLPQPPRLGEELNCTVFAETPYWLFPSSSQNQELQSLCREPHKEIEIADANRKIIWGTGDLNACMMAASRQLPEMSRYLSRRADLIRLLQLSIDAWMEAGFTPDINGNLACCPFESDEQNAQFYSMLFRAPIELSVFPSVFLRVKQILAALGCNGTHS